MYLHTPGQPLQYDLQAAAILQLIAALTWSGDCRMQGPPPSLDWSGRFSKKEKKKKKILSSRNLKEYSTLPSAFINLSNPRLYMHSFHQALH